MSSLIRFFLTGVIVFGVLHAQWVIAELDPEEFQEKLDRAIELNFTAPWPESQAILDELEPLLDQATPEQYAAFQQLTIRNLALDDNMAAALELTEQLLQREDIPAYQRLNALMRGANLAMLARRFEEAFEYLYEALVLEPEIDHPGLDSDVNSVATDMYRFVGEYDRAREHGRIAVQVARQRENLRAECIASFRLAAAVRADERAATTESLEYLREALEVCEQANEPVYTAIAEFGMGDSLRKLGRFDEAESRLASAHEAHLNNNYMVGLAETRLALARLYFDRGEHEASERLLHELKDHFEQAERWDFLGESHDLLGRIAMKRGEYRLALEHANARNEARDRFLDMQRARQLAFLEVEFDTRFKEQELTLLREQARVRELEEQTRQQRRRMQYVGFAAVGFVLMLLTLLLFRTMLERQRFRKLSHRDGLTGLNNHTRFFERANCAFLESISSDTPFTLLLGDIDLFKKINDQYGHLSGDEVLRRVSARLSEVFSGEGIVGRIGGEEFAIALPGKNLDEALTLLEQFRSALRLARAEDEYRPVTMSFGVAEASGEASLTELRQVTDEALYKAKSAGRDRVIIANESS